jgi:hypothetical protein
MVDLAVGTPEVDAINVSVLHTLLHAMLRRLNIVDVQADLNDFDRDFLSASKARKLSVLSGNLFVFSCRNHAIDNNTVYLRSTSGFNHKYKNDLTKWDENERSD